MLNGMFSGNTNKDRNRQAAKPFSQSSRFESNWGKASPVEKTPPRTIESPTSARRGSTLGGVPSAGMPVEKAAVAEKLDIGKQSQQQVITQLASRDMLIVIYELLKEYAVEYNAAVGLGPFYLEMTKPHEVSGPLRIEKDCQPRNWITRVRAGFATSTHALVLSADERSVNFYVVPLEQLHGNGAFGIDAMQNQEPETYLHLYKQKGDGQSAVSYWETKAGLPLTMSRVDATSRALFQWLIERTADRVAGD